MKKSLIALAVLAASGAAMAQSSVTLYGVADVWVGSVKNSVTFDGVTESARETLLESGGVSTSRIGFKGTEDLGGGLKAGFVLEQAIDLADGTASGFTRQATVGLSGGFGGVQLGRDYTAYDDIRGTANNTFDANVSATNAWVGYNGRANSQIKYTSPTFGGVSGALSYSLGGDKALNDNNKASSIVGLHAQYANGPIFVGFAHQTEKAGANTALGVLAPFNSILEAAGELPIVAPDGSKAAYNLITGSYDFGVAKLVGSYNQAKFTAPGVDGSLKANEYQVGVEVPLASNLVLGAGYAQSDLKADGEKIAKSTGFSAALVYSLSKRTSAYAALNQIKLKDTVDLGFQAKSNLYAVGLKHTF